MAGPFDKLNKLAKAFYEGWKWSTQHPITDEDREAFANEVEEPLNCEAARLIGQGYSIDDIDRILLEAKQEVWPYN
ncbi:hypothetical protein JXO52_14015 [bacterium]|nr:hypothetical protein [bacterium]